MGLDVYSVLPNDLYLARWTKHELSSQVRLGYAQFIFLYYLYACASGAVAPLTPSGGNISDNMQSLSGSFFMDDSI